MYGELKRFMKLFTRFEIFLNIQNSYKKFSIFLSLDWSRGIEHQSKSLFDRSNGNRTSIESSRDSKILFLITSIDRIYWISNLTWKILDFEFLLYEIIFSKLKYHYYNVSMYIPIYTTISHEVVIIYVSLDWYSIMHNGKW